MTDTLVGVQHFQMYIGGEFRESREGERFECFNPFNGTTWATVPNGGKEDVDAAVESARSSFSGEWANITGFERASLLRELARLIAEHDEELARAEVSDSGKLYREMILQVRSLSRWFYYYAGLADKIEGKSIPTPNPNNLVYTTREPVGVVAAITPWNAPLMLLTFKLAPALAAGCSIVVKPSEHAPASTLLFAKLVHAAGFPAGVFNVVTSKDPLVGAMLASHPGVDKVAFTGSSATGAKVAAAAASNLNASILELGGKSPQVVFPDADLEETATGIVSGIFAAAGQTCMAGSRVLAHESIHDRLVELIVKLTQRIQVGDPSQPDTQLGPIANEPQFNRIVELMNIAREQGAVAEYGGSADGQRGGLFVLPTVFSGVSNDMTIAREEVFGPVLSILKFTTEEEAVKIANDTEYGLAAGVWTSDIRRAHRVAKAIKAGTVWINSYRSVAESVPFGGFKASGLGRENGTEAILDYTETKSVWVNLGKAVRDPFTLG